MTRAGTYALVALLLATTAAAGPAFAGDAAPLAERYRAEQARVAALRASASPADRRELAAVLADGLIASPNNPLRNPDRDAAAAIYQTALEGGDRSGIVVNELAKLRLRDADKAGFKRLEPLLRGRMFAGDGDAAFTLALASERGLLATPEPAEALMESAAMMGSAAAIQDIAARGAETGEVVKSTALGRLQAKASPNTQVVLAHFYLDGLLVERNPSLAVGQLELAAAAGFPPAMLDLAKLLVRGEGAPADPKRAGDLVRAAADLGSPAAAITLGKDAVAKGPLGVSIEEGRMWLVRAVAIDALGAGLQLATLDVTVALTANEGDAERLAAVEKAIAPIAEDPEALVTLARNEWKGPNARLIGQVLLPMLYKATLQGSVPAGIAYDAWMRANGLLLPEDAADALVAALRRDVDNNVASSIFSLASLAADGRLGADRIAKSETLDLLFRAADADVGQAMRRLAQMYAFGEGVAKSNQFAKRWYEAAASNKVARAPWDLAAMLVRSDDPAEQAEGERYYLRHMDGGEARAAILLVEYRLRVGKLNAALLGRAEALCDAPEDAVALATVLAESGSAANVARARAILQPLVADEPNADALVLLGQVKLSPDASPAEREEGLNDLHRAAEMGSASAKLAIASTYLSRNLYAVQQPGAVKLIDDVLTENPRSIPARLLLANAYLHGQGVVRDSAKASSLIAGILAEGDFPNPQAAILEADWLLFSEERRDPQRAIDILQNQANRGSLASERDLGLSYLSGFGPRQDPDLALGHINSASREGDKEAMAAMGHLFLNGIGTPRSHEDGVHWLERAAEAGNTAAMYDLSRVYALGAFDEVDDEKSVHWLQEAAGRNHPAASYQLGLAYLTGDGIAKNRDEAMKWFERSSSTGNMLAGRTLKMLRDQPDQIPQVEEDPTDFE